MMIHLLRSSSVAVAVLLSATAAAEPVTYAVDPGSSLLYAIVYKAGAASAVAHDHVVRAEAVEGSVSWDKADASTSAVAVTAQVARFVPDTDDMRRRVGLPNTLSDKQRSEILEHILADYQLDAETFRTISFVSTQIVGGGGTYQVTGDFTLRGVTRRISLPMKVLDKDGGLLAAGKVRILQSDYGYKPYSALFGALRVKNEVDIVVQIKLVPKA